MGNEFVALQGLIATIHRLLEKDGCPWDREQTCTTLSHMLLEEVCETIDALPDSNHEHLADELGDLFMTAFFFSKAAERENFFSWDRPFEKATEKLIRRHPHIFEKARLMSPEEVITQWDAIKKTESQHSHRSKILDGISQALPGLAQMQKLCAKVKKKKELADGLKRVLEPKAQENEAKSIGRRLAALVAEAESKGIQAELALRAFFSSCKDELEKEVAL
jgi:uncharacterized protein YabN with tetrapyrrole methylase and pyrophosphatase domain